MIFFWFTCLSAFDGKTNIKIKKSDFHQKRKDVLNQKILKLAFNFGGLHAFDGTTNIKIKKSFQNFLIFIKSAKTCKTQKNLKACI